MQKLARIMRAILWVAGISFFTASYGQLLAPNEVGTIVKGYQDDFDGTVIDSRWQATGTSTAIYGVAGGMLHVSSADGDPNHLLFEAAGYEATTQEVLARIRFTNFGTGDPARGGVSVGVDAGSSQGINFFFRDVDGEGETGRHLAFLDDLRAWGPGTSFPWANNVWYWVRLRQEQDAIFGDGSADIFGKIWLADGSTAEPADWQMWDYIPARSARTGFAGIAAGSLGGISEFDVDYILIKAAGLPSITVAPEAFPAFTPGPVSVLKQPVSTNVNQCASALFSVEAAGTPPISYQWYRNGNLIAGATNAAYAVPSAQMTDSGAQFFAVLANVYNGASKYATSGIVALTVSADQTAPVLLQAANSGLNRILLTFSEAITPDSATQTNHYTITNLNQMLPVLSATVSNGGTNVLLLTSGQIEGVTYTLNVHGLVDLCSGVNLLASTAVPVQAQAYLSSGIGATAPSGSSEAVSGGYNVSGGGGGLNAVADQGQFSYQARSGDFDLKARVEFFNSAIPWAEAGLMAREGTNAGSLFAATVTTPGIGGTMFKTRTLAGSKVTMSGSFPVNYPYTWVRLKRAGDQFTSYASLDGVHWSALGNSSMALPSSILVGYFVSSHSSTELASAGFRDLASVENAEVVSALTEREQPGQATRLTSLVISEIMYHPADHSGVSNSLEYVELFNSAGTSEEIGGYRLDGDIHYTFPLGTFIGPGEYLLIAKSPATIETLYGIAGVYGPFTGSLPNDSGKVQLKNQVGAIFLEVNYGSNAPWPVAADGAGHSLVMARPSLGQGEPGAWDASNSVGGSPGKLDPVTFDPLLGVVINEFLAHSAPGNLDYIELFNKNPKPLDISGCALSDDPATNKFQFPPGTIISPHGYLALDEQQLGFSLKAEGETILLRSGNGDRVLDAIRYAPQEVDVAFGRSPDGSERWGRMSGNTPGSVNLALKRSDIVINEIMYAPISLDDNDEYIELYNRAISSVDLSGWAFTSGIDFTFPSNTVVGPGSYLVVAKNSAHLRTNYSGLNATNLLGDFGGKLSNGGERLALGRPEVLVSTNSTGVVSTQTVYVTVEELEYKNGGRWGQWSDGGGSSLELINPDADNQFASNWADSDESAKAPWTDVQFTGTLDNGSGGNADQLQVLLQGVGECLIDNVQVLNASSQNLIANPDFESGSSGWTAEGTEKLSSIETSEGYNSANSFHLRAVDRGDNQINRVRTPLSTTLGSGVTATIRAKVRWLRGHPEVLLRLRGNWLEAIGEMNLPVAPGTPGARNSRYAPLAAPGIADVKHWPILPRAGENVLVSARIDNSRSGVQATVQYRLDPASNYSSAPMHDDGTNGDELAGDGIYCATIPGQAIGATIAFYVETHNGATATFPNDAPKRECLIRFGETEPIGNIPVYRIWMTQATLNEWNSRPKLDNSPLDVTFVLGHDRVIYNTQALYAGSPYIAPGYCGANCRRCGYSITFPPDDLFLGTTDLVLDWPGGHGNETTAIQEQMAYWIANRVGLPYSHRYFIHLHVNGVTDDQRGSIFEAVNQPAGEFIQAWSPKADEGDFYKVDRGFEFSDSGGLIADPMPTLQPFTTTGGVKKQARYRWNWNKRSAERYNNYTNIFNLVDAVNAASPEPYTSATESLVDTEEWMGVFSLEHMVNNFDSWGHDIGKNMYAYKPDGGKWQLYMFDLDWLMLVANGAGYSAQGPLFNANDPTVVRMYNNPPFRRAYLRRVLEAVNGPFASTNCEPVMDEKYAMLVAHGVQSCDGQSLTAPTALKTWFRDRRTYLVSQLTKAAANFAVAQAPEITAATSPLLISGTAPVEVASIMVNGNSQPLTWSSVTNWSLTFAPAAATTELQIVGLDRQGNFVPGASNVVIVHYTGPVSGYPPVVINEWMAKNNNTIADLSSGLPRYDDWFELYNPGRSAADISGYYLTENPATPFEFKIPGGYSIPAGGRLLVWADGEPNQNSATNSDLHINFQLSASGESIGLFAPDGTRIDLVTFGAQLADVSEGRCPDGSTNIVTFAHATPRTANSCATAPELQGIERVNGKVNFIWNVTPGFSYAVQFKDDLQDESWMQLGDSSTATGSGFSLLIDPAASGHRFYRLMIVP